MNYSTHSIISYSQNREDVLLNRAFRDVSSGFYVDVGANDPEENSLTRAFYDRGWKGINVEPGLVFEKLAANRPRDININAAASHGAAELTLYEFPAANGLSRLGADLPDSLLPYAEGRFPRKVAAYPLRDILARHLPDGQTIDFLSIDVEGHEQAVIEGNDWTRYRPRVVLLESTLPNTPEPCHHSWEPLLLSAGYQFAYFDGLNRFYVRDEDQSLLDAFSVPVNVFDTYTLASENRLLADLSWLRQQYEQLEEKFVQRQASFEEACARAASQLEKANRLERELEDQRRLLEGTGSRALKVGLGLARTLSRLRQASPLAAVNRS